MDIDGETNKIDQKCVEIEQSTKVDDNKTSIKRCNKFSIDSILGLNSHNKSDNVMKSNQREIINFYHKGKN